MPTPGSTALPAASTPVLAPAFLPPPEARVAGHVAKVAVALNVKAAGVAAVAALFAEGATVPFIARYRKEATGNLDEVAIAAIRDQMAELAALDSRKDTVLRSIGEQGKLSDALKAQILAAETLAKVEDLYLPYKPKRETRGMKAAARGLAPLADWLWTQPAGDAAAVQAKAAAFVDAAKEVPDAAAALAGARDIVAEKIADDAGARAALRKLYESEGVLASKVFPGKEEEGAKFRDYFDWKEPAKAAPSHRMLAIRRGATEGFLTFSIQPPEDAGALLLEQRFVTAPGTPAGEQVRAACKEAFKRLLSLQMETEMRLLLKKSADAEAIRVFADNLRQLLLASPLGQKRLLALDPGFRTGCKVAVLDATGKLLHDDKVYLHEPQAATAMLRLLVGKHQIEAVAIGNGTAGRETEALCRSADLKVPVVMVSEAGASVYSASEVARQEFPDKDITVRGAVSIGRRLMDPLAELVKIDPKSIGVGQYQHDVDERQLMKSLDETVVSCVSAVGVEVNTASRPLLTRVAGLNDRVAEAIVAHRDAHGPFKSRADLLKVPGMGPKTFEQAAGFLRVRGGAHPLDDSAVHPERYALVERMAKDAGCGIADLLRDEAARKKLDLGKYVEGAIGLPTLRDILAELAKPGRDPREPFQLFQYAEGVKEMGDLKPGMKLPGVVTNVAAFGAFVDVGVHQDGLVHISQLADRFVQHANEVVKVHQQVEVTVLEVDLARGRIALSMRKNPEAGGRKPAGESRGGQAPAPRGGGGGFQAKPKAPPAGSNNPFGDFFKSYKV